MQGWLVARVVRQRENWACENISSQQAEVYSPKVAKRSRRSRHSELRTTCLFPGYVFVRPKELGQWRFLLSTYGVVGLVMDGNGPALLPDKDVQDIRRREVDGLVELPTRPKDKPRFKDGETVRVANGAFSGNVGIYQGCSAHDRQRILLDMLGRKTPVLIADEDLEKEDPNNE